MNNDNTLRISCCNVTFNAPSLYKIWKDTGFLWPVIILTCNYLLGNYLLGVIILWTQNRSTHRRCSVRKSVLRNFAKFTGKHLCQILFLNKVATGKHLCQSPLFNTVPWAYNFIKTETLTQLFSFEFYKISKSTFFTEPSGWLLLSKT